MTTSERVKTDAGPRRRGSRPPETAGRHFVRRNRLIVPAYDVILQDMKTRRRAPRPDAGGVDWLLACPGKGFFVPIESGPFEA